MRVLDTNVLIRVATLDVPEQAAAGARLLETQRCLVPTTVQLETEWVLRFSYELSRERIGQVFRAFLGYPQLEFEDRPALISALAWFEQGMDFADALHLAACPEGSCFTTFDRKLVNKARKLLGAPELAEL